MIDPAPKANLTGIVDFQLIKRVDLSSVIAQIESQRLRVWIIIPLIILVPCGKENLTAIW
jgi:hypothetical protein